MIMYRKARKKIVIYTFLGSFALLASLLSVINITNFVIAGEEADHLTERIASNHGYLEPNGPRQNQDGFGPGQEGMMESLRYFTYDVTSNSFIVKNMDYIEEEEASTWAIALSKGASIGWSNSTYRYRVYNDKNSVYVTVIDQGRELSPSYRILTLSLITGGVGLVVILLLAILISKRITKPIEDSVNKQKRFVKDASLALKTPVSVISIDNQTLVNQFGQSEMNLSINAQVKKLIDLQNQLEALDVISSKDAFKEEVNLSNLLKDVSLPYLLPFEDNHKKLEIEIEDGITLFADRQMLRKAFVEILDNALKYSESDAKLRLSKMDERIEILFENDAKGIPNGSLDQVFEPFYKLDYQDQSAYQGAGMGLTVVADIVKAHKGRIFAFGKEDRFLLKIEF